MQVTLNDLSGNDKHYNNLTELPLDAMIADKANWTDFSWAHYTPKPEFGDGTVSIASTTETKWALAGYKKQKFRNTEFQFKYRQTAAENDSKTANYGVLSWSFDSSVTNLSWNKAGGVMVTFEPDKTVLYAKGDADNGAVPKSDLTLENGKTYDMTFSFCQISANQLRVVLKVDGKEWFNEVYTDAMLANSAGYFNFGTRDNTSATIEKTGKVVVPEPDPEPTYNVVDVTDMLADTSNWTLGYDNPTFATGSITAKTADAFIYGGALTASRSAATTRRWNLIRCTVSSIRMCGRAAGMTDSILDSNRQISTGSMAAFRWTSTTTARQYTSIMAMKWCIRKRRAPASSPEKSTRSNLAC